MNQDLASYGTEELASQDRQLFNDAQSAIVEAPEPLEM